MGHYIIHSIAFQLFFLLIYDVFLKKETFFNWNRVYLIITAILSIILPFIQIESFKKVVPQDYIISLPEVVLGATTKNINSPTELNTVIIETGISYWYVAFYLGLTVAALLFLFKLSKILFLIFKNPKTKTGKLILVKLINSNAAFSFFRYVFLGEFLKNEEKEAILKHESIHAKHMHTIDLLVFEILRILFWFNPLMYMYQNRITMLHEFIADDEAVKHQGKSHYYQNLLSQVFDTKKISFINPFFKQSLIKKRIVMLQKSKSKQIHLFKYALLIPLVLGMLVYTSCEKDNETNQTDALDLSQYSYTWKMEEGQMSEENRAIYNKHRAILKENPEYAQWVIFDDESKTASYSIHHEDEERPKELESKLGKVVFKGREGSNKMYFLSKRLPESEQSVAQNEKGENEIEVPFAVIDQVPVFPGCEGMSNDEQKKCMSDEITKHVGKNFNTNIGKENGLTGRQRISVIFKIDKEGNVVEARSRAPHPTLEAEAIRVVNMLPKMIPGKQSGQNVTVPYALPIVFQVEE